MNIAHLLTLFRIVVSPLFLFLYLLPELTSIDTRLVAYCLGGLWGLLELSDACDGFLARRYGQVTDIGKVLDPMADSIVRISIFLTFSQPPISLSVIWVFIFIYRDLAVNALRTLCALKGIPLAARPSGKRKALAQATASGLVLLFLVACEESWMSRENLWISSNIVVGCAAAYTLYSGIDYFSSHWKALCPFFYSHKE